MVERFELIKQILAKENWLARIAQRMLKNRELADDAAQEAIVRAVSHLDQLRDEYKLGAWLRKILIHLCLEIVEKAKAARRRESARIVPENEPSALDDLPLVMEVLSTMSDSDRKLLRMHFISGKTAAAIGRIEGIAERTIQRRLKAARGRFDRAWRRSQFGQ